MSLTRPCILSISLLALGACGGIDDPNVPAIDDPNAAAIDEGVTTTTSPLWAVDDCAPNPLPHAKALLSTTAETYTRESTHANPGGCSGDPIRATTVVEFEGNATDRARWVVNATFTGAQNGIICPFNSTKLRVQRKVGSSWTDIAYFNNAGNWTGSTCLGQAAYELNPFLHSPVGDYRVRAQATQLVGGFVEEITIIGYRFP